MNEGIYLGIIYHSLVLVNSLLNLQEAKRSLSVYLVEFLNTLACIQVNLEHRNAEEYIVFNAVYCLLMSE